MQTLNQLTLIGYVAKAPFYMTTEKAAADLTRFELLTEQPTRVAESIGEAAMDRHQCVAWGPVSLQLHQHLYAGSRVAIGGRLQYRQFADTNGQQRSLTEIVVERFTFLDQGR
jgi:single stranded DNA-binding protein